MDNDTINTVFKKYINPLNFKVIQRMIDQSGMDKYAKKVFYTYDDQAIHLCSTKEPIKPWACK